MDIYCVIQYYFFFVLSSQSNLFLVQVNLQLILGNKNTYTIFIIFLYTKINMLHFFILVLLFREKQGKYWIRRMFSLFKRVLVTNYHKISNENYALDITMEWKENILFKSSMINENYRFVFCLFFQILKESRVIHKHGTIK